MNRLKLKQKLSHIIYPDLEKGRKNWDKNHTKAAVYYAEKIIKNNPQLNLDYEVLLIAIYAHDWGYSEIYKKDKQNIQNAKKMHMKIGAQKTKSLLEKRFFEFLDDNQKEKIIHLVGIHDNLAKISSLYESIVVEADTLGMMDTNLVTPTFNYKQNLELIKELYKERLPLFKTAYSQNKFKDLTKLRKDFYNFKKTKIPPDELAYKVKSEHEGRLFKGKFYLGNAGVLPRIDQVQAVTFYIQNNKKDIVMYKHRKGFNGLPGGGVEKDENIDEALRREIEEEINCALLEWGPLGYGIVTQIDTNKTFYHGRYWALVKPLKGSVSDPCKKSRRRLIVPLKKAASKLGWGPKGKILIDNALKKIEQSQLLALE